MGDLAKEVSAIALHAVHELYAARIGFSMLCIGPNRMILKGFFLNERLISVLDAVL
jgi:hypothetical protein